jgi:hypothetical protein
MTDRTMTDEEAADLNADPANQTFDPTRVVRRRALTDSIPVRLPANLIDQVRRAADTDGITVSEWVRQAVAPAVAQRDHGAEDTTAIAKELERAPTSRR